MTLATECSSLMEGHCLLNKIIRIKCPAGVSSIVLSMSNGNEGRVFMRDNIPTGLFLKWALHPAHARSPLSRTRKYARWGYVPFVDFEEFCFLLLFVVSL